MAESIFKMCLITMTFGAPVWILASVIGSIIKKTSRARVVLAGISFAFYFVLINLLWQQIEFAGLPLWYPRLLLIIIAFVVFAAGMTLLVPKYIELMSKSVFRD